MKILCSSAGGTGSIPDQGTKISHAMWRDQNEKIKFWIKKRQWRKCCLHTERPCLFILQRSGLKTHFPYPPGTGLFQAVQLERDGERMQFSSALRGVVKMTLTWHLGIQGCLWFTSFFWASVSHLKPEGVHQGDSWALKFSDLCPAGLYSTSAFVPGLSLKQMCSTLLSYLWDFSLLKTLHTDIWIQEISAIAPSILVPSQVVFGMHGRQCRWNTEVGKPGRDQL